MTGGNLLKLYELSEQYNRVMELAEELDPDTLKDTLESIDEAFELKLENTAKVVRTLSSTVDVISNEIRRLQQRKTALNNNIAGLKHYMQEEMEKTGKEKVKGELFNIRIQNNNPSVEILDEEKIDLDYFDQQPPKPNKERILKDLKEGKEIEGATLKQTRSIRIG